MLTSVPPRPMTTRNQRKLQRTTTPIRPESADLSVYSQAYLQDVEGANDRQCKTLDYDKSSERILELTS